MPRHRRRPLPAGSLSDLIAAKDYARAIELLREQLAQRPPGIQRRLQLADLLLLAGRREEAVPILMGLADELRDDGFTAKAVAILKRIDRIKPGRADVETRLAQLARRPAAPEPTAPPEPAPEPPAAPVVPKPAPEKPAEDAAEAPTTAAPTPPAPSGITTMLKRLFTLLPSKATVPEATTPVDSALPPPPESAPDVPQKLGGVFKRFLAGLPDNAAIEPQSEDAARELVAALTSTGTPFDGDLLDSEDGELVQAFLDDEEALPPAPPEAPAAEPAPPVPAPRKPTAPSPITEEAFRDQVLDLLEDALRQPGPEPPPALAAYQDTLLLHPLFADLSPEEMLAMLRALRLVIVEPGEIIVTEGEPGASLFLIISGDVRLFVRNPGGHNVEVGHLSEGAFFGEMSLLSGRPRNATIAAASRVEMLELPKALLDEIAQAHPRVRDIVDALYIQRASSPEVAAVRNVPTGDRAVHERAMEVLKTYFGGRRFEPRMQLKLATVLLKAGKYEEAVPVLILVAHELLQEDTAKAIAVLKKVELIRTRFLRVMTLAPLPHDSPDAVSTPPPAPESAPSWAGRTAAFFEEWLADIIRSAASSPAAPSRHVPGYGPELRAHPLFEGFTEEELLALIQGMRLCAFEPGEIILTEGEPGESVFILASGSVRVSVRDPRGHNIALSNLGEGAFFGEISTLSGRPRSATVTAAARCELLELDRPTLDAIVRDHPRVRQVLEDTYIERASSPEAERIRTTVTTAPSEP